MRIIGILISIDTAFWENLMWKPKNINRSPSYAINTKIYAPQTKPKLPLQL